MSVAHVWASLRKKGSFSASMPVEIPWVILSYILNYECCCGVAQGQVHRVQGRKCQ